MPPTCTVCRHKQRISIDRALLAGDSVRDIAKRFGPSSAAVHRHREHLTARVVETHEAKVVSEAKDLLEELSALHRYTKRLIEDAQDEETRNYSALFAGIRELGRQIDLMHKFAEAKELRSTHPMADPRLIAIIASLLEAIRPHPEAYRDVMAWLAREKARAPHPLPPPRGDSSNPE